MKVALLGNRHQSNHVLVRLLRDRGVDAFLLNLSSDSPWDHPAHDRKALDFSTYARTLAFGDSVMFGSSTAVDVRRALGSYGALVATGNAPAFLAVAGLRADLILADDVALSATHFHLNVIRRKAPQALVRFPMAQRDAFRRARAVIITSGSQPHAAAAAALTQRAPHTLRLPAVYTHNNDYSSTVGTQWGAAVAQVRDASDLLLLHPSRHEKSSRAWFTGLVAGLARLRAQRPSLRVTMLTTETGPDLAAAQHVVRSAQLDQMIRFFPPMARKDLLCAVCAAHAVVSTPRAHGGIAQGNREAEELGTPFLSWPPNTPYFDGKPDAQSTRLAVVSDDNAERIALALTQLVDNFAARRAAAQTAATYFAAHVIPDALNQVLALLHPPLMA